jgi:protein TonB
MAGTGASPVVRDRLMATFMLAAILHGLLILGVTFSAAVLEADSSSGLDVLLVSDEVPEADRNDSAAYLSQRTQLGSGNYTGAAQARNAASPAVQPPALAPVPTAEDTSDALVSTSSPFAANSAGAEESMPVDDPSLILERPPTSARPPSDDGEARLHGPDRQGVLLAADTKAASLAPYLAVWRSKVERIGTLNYPAAARHLNSRTSPVVEVVISANGKLVGAAIRRSSGYADLDQAALSILKLASPFDPFPADLARERPVLRFAYEWQFVAGHLESGDLSAVP